MDNTSISHVDWPGFDKAVQAVDPKEFDTYSVRTTETPDPTRQYTVPDAPALVPPAPPHTLVVTDDKFCRVCTDTRPPEPDPP